MQKAGSNNRNPVVLLIGLIFCGCYFCPFSLSADNTRLGQLLDESERQARKVSDKEDRFLLLDNIALYRAKIGQIEEAKRLIKELEPDFATNYSNPKNIFEEIARQLARSGNVDAALEAARTAGSVSKTVNVVVIKNKSESKSENSDAADKPNAKQSTFPKQSDEALFAVAKELLIRGMFDDVNRILGQIARPDNIRRRAQILNDMAAIAVVHGWKELGDDLFSHADVLSFELTSKSGLQAATVELALSNAAQRRLCGDLSGANRIFATVQNQVATVSDKAKKEQYLDAITEAAAVSGDFELANKTLALITEPMRMIQARDAIVRALLAEGRIQEAEMMVPSIPDIDTRIRILLLIAELQMDRNEGVLQKTLDLIAKSIGEGSDDHKAWETANLASLEYRRGNRKRAIDLWKQAIRQADRFTIHPDREKLNLIEYVARLQAEVGEEKIAMETARLLQYHSVFSDIAESESANGKAESALKWINKLKGPEIKAHSLLGVVSGLLDSMNAKESSRSFGYVSLSECK
jgi:tetratricopeptide (TPR) repeat protein